MKSYAVLLLLWPDALLARGASCHTAECEQMNLWIAFFLGYIGVFLLSVRKRPPRTWPYVPETITAFFISIAVAFIALIAMNYGTTLDGNTRIWIAMLSAYFSFYALCRKALKSI